MSEEKEVKVVDKRMFSEDGELRTETGGEEKSTNPGEATEKQDQSSPGGEKPPEERGPLPEKINFSTFIVTLYTSAAMHLGLIQIPNGPEEKDINAAKQSIDILELIKEKTKGNLTSEEEKLLDELLAQLQLVFVKSWQKD